MMISGVLRLCAIALTLGASATASAQSAAPPQVDTKLSLSRALDAGKALTLSGSVRLRFETIDGQARAGFNGSDQLVDLRTTLFAEYRTGPFRFGAELYDSRAYGANIGTPLSTSEVDAFELVQAYVAADLPLGGGTKATVQAGRFVLSLGSRRLIANDEYRNTTNAFTGLRGDVALTGGRHATVFYVLPNVRLPDDGAGLRRNGVKVDRQSFDQVLWGGLASAPRAVGGASAEIALYHFGERDAPGRQTRDRSLNSVGVRLYRDPAAGKIDYEFEPIYQFGRTSLDLAPTSARQSVDAWFVHAELGYSHGRGWKPHVSLEFDVASGDRAGGSYNRFDPLFGMRRGDFAPGGLYNALARTNLVTPGVRVEVTPSKRVDAFVSYRALWLESASDAFATTGVRDATGRSGNFAGHQLEARVRYWLIPATLRFEADANLLLKGGVLNRAPNAPRDGDTRYLSLNLTAFL